MKSLFTAALSLAVAGTLMAKPAQKTAQESHVPKSDKEKASYAIGVDMGSSVKALPVELPTDFIVQGLRDAIQGKPALSQEEMKTAIGNLQKEVQEKAEAKHKADTATNAAASKKFLEENAKKEGVKTTASGLQYKIIKEGKGAKPTLDDTVVVKYKGTLIDGTEFDNSEKHGGTVEFPLKGIIPGWAEALQMMSVGSTWELVIPAELAYGENAPPVIGPNQALLFTIELVDIKKGEKPEQGGEAK